MIEVETAAELLASATRDGRLADAYKIVQAQPFRQLQAVALRAGFSCIFTRNRREFVAHLTSQIADAARNRTDGFGLRERRQPEVAG